ncbi:mitochondrial ribosome-associated GTPase 2 [Leptopilina heterotoma]|uniref:mitochondrial ribosome-associated GTPase 2 n=1 Tax=Leptopilina heterotoma TaxID=63436 RepID=UPI001CAA193F|nr:mitochondrial ribosome-associated GTPase 2 [Leptopilina heterotoma]
MNFLQRLKKSTAVLRAIQRQEINFITSRKQVDNNFICSIINRTFTRSNVIKEEYSIPLALRNKKAKSTSHTYNYFVDIRQVKVEGGFGGDGIISFMQLFSNEKAGPSGGDGGNGGHVIFEVSADVKDLRQLKSVHKAKNGQRGMGDNCYGKSAEHLIIKVPVGTIIRDIDGKIIADLDEEGMKFIAARGGAGGHGNPYFKSETNQTPLICESGAEGEKNQYLLEIKSMAHIGLIGLPNAGKSTLLRAISRARPKVASYPFTTLRPHVGIVQYDDYEQVAVADLPGLIQDSHKNKGLGVQFLKHAERCKALLFIIDMSSEEPWNHFDILKYEISQFNPKLIERQMIIIANKMDLPSAQENLKLFEEKINLPIISISAKFGTNVTSLLRDLRILYDDLCKQEEKQ